MTDTALQAALYLEAVLPALPLLASHDDALAVALAGPDVSLFLSCPGDLRARLAIVQNVATVTRDPQPGDVHLWFPFTGQLVRAFDGSGRTALALPLRGFTRLGRARRLIAAGKRLEVLLNTRADPHLALHAWGSLLVGIHAATTWLRHHSDGPATRARLGTGAVVFSCPAFPAPLWLDLAMLSAGTGEPPSAVMACIEFTDLATVLAELDHQLDAPAALGLGTLRIRGHLPLAENLGQVMLKAGNLLKPVNH
ncbi:MAG: hypothetical protein K0R17_894 [Rariglobus sp.]|jgi:hypothetical protein|nr:hypothetical protein [Rariglobus sp.]